MAKGVDLASKEISFWVKGKVESIACINGYVYADGIIVLSAEKDRMTKAQFERGVRAHFPTAEQYSVVYDEAWWFKMQVVIDQEHLQTILEE